MNIKSRWFYFLFFITVIFFVFTLPLISSAQLTNELVFQMTGKQGIVEAREKKVEQVDKGQESSDISFLERSIANHINQFQSCGFNRDDIKVKKSNRQSNNIIAYVIYGSSRNLKCLISKKSKIPKELSDENLIFFQSRHDDNSFFEHPHSNPENRKIYPLDEGLIKFDDRFIVFTAPGSKGGVIDITKFTSDSVLVKVAYPLRNANYLVTLPALKLDNVNLNRVNVIEKINKGSKKTQIDLTAQENQFNAPKQKRTREIDDLRATIKLLRNQLANLKSVEKSSVLASPASSKQRNKTVDNLDKTANRKGIVQRGHSIDSEINAKDYILVVTRNRPLNVRKKSSTLSPVIASLLNGSKVPFTGTTASDATNFNGPWYQVEYSKEKFGWVSSDYSRKVKKSKNKPSPPRVAKLESNKLAPVKTKGFLKTPFLSSTDINPQNIAITNLYKWTKAWESRNTPLYFSFYSANFKDPKRSRSKWEAYRRKALKKAKNISVQVLDIKTYLTKKNIIKVTFTQRFKSKNFSDVGLKELVWEKGPKGWKIIKESWEPWPEITKMEN